MQTAQGNTTMFIGHAADKRAVGEEGNVHGREGQESVHDVWGGGSDSQQTGFDLSAQSHPTGGRATLTLGYDGSTR